MVIVGPIWFVGALLICGGHALYIRSWRRERRQQLARSRAYDANAQARHDEFMGALTWYQRGKLGWNNKGGQA